MVQGCKELNGFFGNLLVGSNLFSYSWVQEVAPRGKMERNLGLDWGEFDLSS
jgi:hypothetical protein